MDLATAMELPQYEHGNVKLNLMPSPHLEGNADLPRAGKECAPTEEGDDRNYEMTFLNG
jgi:hypothetical protein